MAPKRTLLRYVVVDATVVADPEARQPGRGAYTCRDDACLGQARARGGFNRAFRQPVRAPRPPQTAQDDRRRPAPRDHENVHLRHE